MTTYADKLTLKQALREHFAASDFGEDGGYGDKWVKFKAGPIPIAFPNFAARRRALPMHDLHHIVTGYDTNLVGEFEISAFEVAAGCGEFTAAWSLNLFGLASGVFLAPRRVFRAFVRGLRSESLYHATPDDHRSEVTVGQLRRRLHIPTAELESTGRERLTFAAWLGIACAWSLLWIAVLIAPLVLAWRAF